MTPDSHLADVSTVFEDFHPIICCTVSRRITGGEHSEGGYIQGAGDDTENWAYGLTPTIFWENQQTLLSTSEADLPELIEMLVRRKAASFNPAACLTFVRPTSCLSITELNRMKSQPKDAGAHTITITLKPEVTDQSTWLMSPTYFEVGVGPHKVGQRNLRAVLPSIMDFVKTSLSPAIVDNHANMELDMKIRTQQHALTGSPSPPSNKTLNDTNDTNESPKADSTSSNEHKDSPKSEPASQLGASSPTSSSQSPKYQQPTGQDRDTKRVYTTLAQRPKSENPYANLVNGIDKQIIIACETGKDLSIGVGLAIICLFFNDDGELLSHHCTRRVMNKDFIRSRLAWFSTSMPDANPSRGTLQSVNSFLMDHRREG